MSDMYCDAACTGALWAAHLNASNRKTNMKTCWAEAPIKIARMTLTIKLDGNWSSFQLANSAPPLSVTDSAIAPSARMWSRAVWCHLCSGFPQGMSVTSATEVCIRCMLAGWI